MPQEFQNIPIDPWIASSLLQKSIRRGEADVAVAAAKSFIRQRGNAIWSKLIVIACEDVGLGDLNLVSKVIRLSLNAELRLDAGGDEQVALALCEDLANAVKDRSADYLWISASRHPGWRGVRETIGTLSINQSIRIATNPCEPFDRRAVAAWYASGFNEESSALRDGDLCGLFGAFKASGVPEELADDLYLAAKKTRRPLVVMLAVLWHMLANDTRNSSVVICPTLEPRSDDRIPLYALDKHTRIGKRAISTYVRDCPEIRRVFARYLPAFLARSAGCLAVFYAEGVLLMQRLEWGQSKPLEAICNDADLLNAGCPASGIQPIIETVRNNIGELNVIRRRLFDREYPTALTHRVFEEVGP